MESKLAYVFGGDWGSLLAPRGSSGGIRGASGERPGSVREASGERPGVSAGASNGAGGTI